MLLRHECSSLFKHKRERRFRNQVKNLAISIDVDPRTGGFFLQRRVNASVTVSRRNSAATGKEN